MSSTNIFKGLTGERNTSKVIKPPGGGHTDIFGAPDPPVKRDTGRNASSIMEGTNTPAESSGASKASATPKEAAPEAPAPAGAAPPAGRVPPGGFSSGPFW